MMGTTCDSNDGNASITYIKANTTQTPQPTALPRTFFTPPEIRTPSGNISLTIPNTIFGSTLLNP